MGGDGHHMCDDDGGVKRTMRRIERDGDNDVDKDGGYDKQIMTSGGMVMMPEVEIQEKDGR